MYLIPYVFWSKLIYRFKFFVYSAYYDDRVAGNSASGKVNKGIVRVISATKTRGPERVWCRLWYRQQNSGNVTASVTVAAKVKVKFVYFFAPLSLFSSFIHFSQSFLSSQLYDMIYR